ncbi:NADH dehydrogenase [ubiquinone] 1 beta subcomplex subunit 7 [Grifola frondosa]|uniref:NADH dehydrogenase [ubiquinone] 1 beta subcomplex subunit 7 n=1 Tax=Grifola frondosa TaxID=5627 RepID=A0A1C7LPC2_GRIFR|nr:NADH dehydrogenase [ubiquinone] 1 beta subcomplex subunit 7 [Grifola frondosa]
MSSQTEQKAVQMPLTWRDSCSALLIPLNVCRRDKFYLPWECDHERHTYENYIRRMKELSKQKSAAAQDE